MAITKERLEALIGEGATIYAIVKNPFIAGYSQILKVEEFDLNAPIIKEISEDGKQFLYFNYLLELEYLFETKEEAEFVLKFHTSKTVYFQPPNWEEFLRTETDELKPNYTCENLVIVEDYNEIIVEDYNNDLNEKHFSYNKELNSCKEKYYEAVEYAKKLFLGEEK